MWGRIECSILRKELAVSNKHKRREKRQEERPSVNPFPRQSIAEFVAQQGAFAERVSDRPIGAQALGTLVPPRSGHAGTARPASGSADRAGAGLPDLAVKEAPPPVPALKSVPATGAISRRLPPQATETDRRLALQGCKPDPHFDGRMEGINELEVDRASDAQPEPLEWLWPGRIPLGCLTLLAGEPDTGKSLVTMDLAARVSRGMDWPVVEEPAEGADGNGAGNGETGDARRLNAGLQQAGFQQSEPRHPENVLILTTHDDLEGVVIPRLTLAGADLERVVFVHGVGQPEAEADMPWCRPTRFPDDFRSLEKTIVKHAPVRLVVLDPAWAFCVRGQGCSRQEGPAQLRRLAELAAAMHVAIVCVTDLKRGSTADRAFQPAADRPLTAAARAAWGIVPHASDEDKRVMIPLKMNFGPKGTLLDFRITEGVIAWDPEPSRLTMEAIIASRRAGRRDLAWAMHWLSSYLENGPRPQKEIFAQAKECGLSKWMLYAAKAALSVDSVHSGFNGDGAHWDWVLPNRDGRTQKNVQIFETAQDLRTNPREIHEGAAHRSAEPSVA